MEQIQDQYYAEKIGEIAGSIYSFLNANINNIGLDVIGMQ
jgi:hypothetical protein